MLSFSRFPAVSARLIVVTAGAVATAVVLPAPVQAAGGLQAEDLRAPGRSARVITVPGAGAGKALSLRSRTSARGAARFGAGRLVVRAAALLCEGAPRVRVRVDGRRVLAVSVRSTTLRDYVSPVRLSEGRHRIAVRFSNGRRVKGVCARRLIVDRIGTRPAAVVPVATPAPAASPAPQPASAAAPVVDGTTVFDGDFARGLSPWATQIHPERIALVPDPILGARRTVARYTVYDGDTAPTANPRAQLQGPANLLPGQEYWVGWSTLFPADFPTVAAGGFLTFMEIYGTPYAGAGPMAVRVIGDKVVYQRNRNYRDDVPFSTPVQRGRWTDFVVHVKLSPDPSVGFIEIYMNTGGGWQQQTLAGQRRLYTRTIDASNNGGPNSFRLNNYRKKGMSTVVTLYQASPKVGTSFDTVAPRSY